MKAAAQSLACPYRDDTDLRNQLVLQYLPAIQRMVQRMACHLPPDLDQADLVNIGILGLIQAIENYDPSHQTQLWTYATHRIRGAILSDLRSRDILTRGARQKARHRDAVAMELEQRLGREPEDAEIIQAMGIDTDEYHRIRHMTGLMLVSLDEIAEASDSDAGSILSLILTDPAEDSLSQTCLYELRTALAQAIEGLKNREQLVISLYYVEELTMKEIAQVMNITESRVSQIHSQAVRQLRKVLIRKGLIN